MSIDWPTIKAEIAATMLAISGLPAPQVYWRDEAVASTFHQDPMVSLRINTVTRQGIEEVRYDYNGAANQTVTVCGQRRFVLSVRAESFEQDIASPLFAGNVLDKIAIRLMRPTSLALRTSFAIENRMPTTWMNYKDNGRQVSCYIMDIQCRTVDNDTDDTATAGDFINRVIGGGTIDDVADTFDVTGDS